MVHYFANVTYTRTEYMGTTQKITRLCGALAKTQEQAETIIRNGIESKSVEYSYSYFVIDIDFVEIFM